MADPVLSIIVPTLNEAGSISELLDSLASDRAVGAEVIVVDGGSTDNTAALASEGADCVLRVPRGRANQLIAGADRARGEILWFLHADSQIPPGSGRAICAAVGRRSHVWGYFPARLKSHKAAIAVVSWTLAWRVRLTRLPTGDHGVFVTRSLYREIGGMPALSLMEDVVLGKRLRRHSNPIRMPLELETSARRWEQAGVVSTVLRMWALRLLYFLGVQPHRLARFYPPQT
ncbi:MAG: TIGR04283 family arsenosugar biosynthesis glycosyltransferase [Pseudomonadota bacterium]